MIRKSLPEIFWRRLSDPRVVFLATSDRNQPRIRPVTLIGFESRLFVHSYKETAKIKQMKKNPKVEFCMFMGKSAPSDKMYARVRCNAKVIDEKEIKEKLLEQIDFIKSYNQSSDDPDYFLIELHPLKWWLT
jgi:uncharacterized pyridoxamine 5'-phosphate oxidase family protein